MMLTSSLGVEASHASSRSPRAPGVPGQGPFVSCANAQLRTAASTDRTAYPASATVHVRAVITNVSTHTCSVDVGGTSPTFTIYNAAGVAQWSYCSSLVQPEMCPQYLRVVNLAPRASYSATDAWPMATSSSPPAAGLYRLHVVFGGVAQLANAYFDVGPPLDAPHVVTEAQSGTHVTLRVGDHVLLRLNESIYRWSAVRSSNPKVLVASSSSPATFWALAVGTATLRATGTPKCYPQCLLPSRLFQLTVTVGH